jgi:hypothetical protein
MPKYSRHVTSSFAFAEIISSADPPMGICSIRDVKCQLWEQRTTKLRLREYSSRSLERINTSGQSQCCVIDLLCSSISVNE